MKTIHGVQKRNQQTKGKQEKKRKGADSGGSPAAKPTVDAEGAVRLTLSRQSASGLSRTVREKEEGRGGRAAVVEEQQLKGRSLSSIRHKRRPAGDGERASVAVLKVGSASRALAAACPSSEKRAALGPRGQCGTALSQAPCHQSTDQTQNKYVWAAVGRGRYSSR